MRGIDDAQKERVLLAAEHFARTMRDPGSGSLAEWEQRQAEALRAFLDTVEQVEAERATDS